MKGIRLGGSVLVLAAALAACPTAEPPRRVEPARVEPSPVPTPPMYFVHEITFRGQTLGRIARWYTGDFENWKKLTRPVNPDLTVCCVPLRVRRKVNIPRDLVERTDPMPRPVTRKAPPLKKSAPEPTKAEAAEPEATPEPTAPPPTAEPEPTKAPPTEAPEEAEPEDDPLDIIGPR